MSRTFTLIDVEHGTYLEDAVIDAAATGEAARPEEWRISMSRLRGGLSDGVDVVELDNGLLRLNVMPTRGMGIWKGRIAGVPLLWNSPVENPVHPTFIDPMRRGGIGWLDGFNELICRCGLGWNGAPGVDVIKDKDGTVISEQFLPLHGRIANLPAHTVRVDVADDDKLTVAGVVDEASVFGGRLRLTSELSTYPGSNSFEITDTIRNSASAAAETEMLYHCNFGRPFLGQGATFLAAVAEVVPRNARAAEDIDTWQLYQDAQPGYVEQVYFMRPVADEHGQAVAMLRSPDKASAIVIRFDTSTLPWLTLWKNTQADADGYCTGIEPGTGLPNLRTFEREHGRVVVLEPEQSITCRFTVSVLLHREDVEQTEAEIAALQGDNPPVVHPTPLADWCA